MSGVLVPLFPESSHHGGRERSLNSVTVKESDFPFGRMYVHVDVTRVHFQKEERDRVLALGESAAVGVSKRMRDDGAFNGTTVQKAKLQGGGLISRIPVLRQTPKFPLLGERVLCRGSSQAGKQSPAQ